MRKSKKMPESPAPCGTLPADRPTRTREEWLRWVEGVLKGDKKPEDYLPLAAEVERVSDVDLAFAKGHPGSDWAMRQLLLNLLSYHYGGVVIGRITDDRGVIVLAVGLDEVSDLVRSVPYELAAPVGFDAPTPWGRDGVRLRLGISRRTLRLKDWTSEVRLRLRTSIPRSARGDSDGSTGDLK